MKLNFLWTAGPSMYGEIYKFAAQSFVLRKSTNYWSTDHEFDLNPRTDRFTLYNFAWSHFKASYHHSIAHERDENLYIIYC